MKTPIIINSDSIDALNAAISAAEGRATARLADASDALRLVEYAEARLDTLGLAQSHRPGARAL